MSINQEPGPGRKMFYSTGEVCRRVGIPAHKLRYWEKRLELKFHRSKAGRRIFRREDVDLLARVVKCVQEGYALKGAKMIIKGMSQMELPLDSSMGPLKKVVRRVRRELADLLDWLR